MTSLVGDALESGELSGRRCRVGGAGGELFGHRGSQQLTTFCSRFGLLPYRPIYSADTATKLLFCGRIFCSRIGQKNLPIRLRSRIGGRLLSYWKIAVLGFDQIYEVIGPP